MINFPKIAHHSISRHLLRRLVFEWLFILLTALGLLWWLSGTGSVLLANDYIYDRVLSSHERVADSDIVVVAIDEESLAQFGRWPWDRKVHADFLTKLAQAKPRGVLFDVLFIEPSANAIDDVALSQAIDQTPNLVLPLLLMPTSERVGLDGGLISLQPIFHQAVTGHIAVATDMDGVVRNMRLHFKQGIEQFNAIGLQLLMLGESESNKARVAQRVQATENMGGVYGLPLNVPKGGYMTVSYRSIIDGEVSADFLRDKYVLVGATALGLGDQFTTPVSGSDGTVSGIEIHANLMDGLKNGWVVHTVDDWYLLALPIVLLMFAFLLVKERFHLWLFLTILVGFVALVWGLMWWRYIWLPPVLTVIGLLWVYLLWSWRRLAIFVRYAQAEWREIQASAGGLLPLLSGHTAARFAPHALELGMSYTQRLHTLVSDSLAHFPSAVFVVDDVGVIRFHNQQADAVCARVHIQCAEYMTLKKIFAAIDNQADNWPWDMRTKSFKWLNDRELSGDSGVFLLHVVAIAKSDEVRSNAWLVNLLELTSERQAQQTRADLVKFLSHDLRTPQVAILAALDLYPSESPVLRQEVTHHVHRTLDWANDMVALTQAQHNQLVLSDVNLASVAQEVMDEFYPIASAKKIKWVMDEVTDDAYEALWLRVDAGLIRRAVMNLLSNAVRYSQDSSCVFITVSIDESYACLTVRDQGVGMSEAQVVSIQTNTQAAATVRGAQSDAAGNLGIGLSVVQTVMRRHGGVLAVQSQLNKGSAFTLRFPKSPVVTQN